MSSMRPVFQETALPEMHSGREGECGAGMRHSVAERDDLQVRRLLVPIRNAEEVVYGARYARNLMDREGVAQVKVYLLHVRNANLAGSMLNSLMKDPLAGHDGTQSFIDEAGAVLDAYGISYSSHVRWGDVVFMIFDSAEQHDCHEIVVPESRPPLLARMFSQSTTLKLIGSRRSIPVIMVNANGGVCASSLDAAKDAGGMKNGRTLQSGHAGSSRIVR